MTPPQPSATPRTDAAFRKCICHNLDLHVLAGDMAKMEVELAASKAECERVRGLFTVSTIAHSQDVAELARLRAEVERLTARVKDAEDFAQLNRDGFIHWRARAERAELEVLSQAAILGRSAEREAALLGKLSRAEHALAAARKDSQRLDWLEHNGETCWSDTRMGICRGDDGQEFYGDSIRDAIDAASAQK